MIRYQKKRFVQNVIIHSMIILAIVKNFVAINVWAEDESYFCNEEKDNHLSANIANIGIETLTLVDPYVKQNNKITQEFPEFEYDKDWEKEDDYLLAKIAMAEAEDCDTHTKELVILTVLNRMNSSLFPDTINDVVYQTSKSGIAQFTPTQSNRWLLEPNEDCWQAVKNVKEAEYDFSQGCLYFESCENEDNWHSRNLEFLFESNGVRFYR